MDSQFWSQLVVLLIAVLVAGCFGFILGSLYAPRATADQVGPLPQREFEHECDAHYPRFGD
jgi:hypothetical protein